MPRLTRSRSLSFSEITTALTCFAQWDFKYGGRLAGSTLSRKAIAPQLSGGRAWGAAIAAYHEGAGTLLGSWSAIDAMRASLDDDERKMAEAGVLIPGLLGVRADMEAHLGAVFADYASRTPNPTPVSRLEQEIIVPLPSRSGGRASNLYRFLCFLDAMEGEGEDEWLWEFKLRGRLSKRWLVELGRQYRWYSWARQRQTGKRVVGIKIVERLNDFPHPPKIVQAGKESALIYECPRCNANPGDFCENDRGTIKTFHAERSRLTAMTFRPSHDADQLTTPELYLAACKEWDMEPNDETVQALSIRSWQRTFALPFRPSELDEAGRELVSAARLIRDLDSGLMYPIRNAKAATCGYCDFKGICNDPKDGLFIEQSFRRSVPKRLREPKPSDAKPGDSASGTPPAQTAESQPNLEEVPF